MSCKCHVVCGGTSQSSLIFVENAMAANEGLKWQELLSGHPVFRELLPLDGKASSKTTEESEEKEPKNILIENDGEIFVWNSAKSNLLTANLKNLHFENERAYKFQVSVKVITLFYRGLLYVIK